MARTRIRARPSRGMSLIGAAFGVVVVVVGGSAGAPGWWLLAAIAIIGINLYNAFSDRGISTTSFLVETDDDRPLIGRGPGRYCGQCGAQGTGGDRFCRHCGAPLAPTG